MKKLFRTLIIILLLLGGGFMFVLKNPSFPLSTQILDAIGISTKQDTLSTGKEIDLKDCVSYFDGCNTCTVSGGTIVGCTETACTTFQEPKCLQYTSGTRDQGTGIDLSTCKHYFDGCNTCSVGDNGQTACTLMYCETPGQPKCLDNEISDQGQGTSAGLANPASVKCEQDGGTLAIQKDVNGGEYGMCTFKDGTTCEERAYFRGECTRKDGTAQVNGGSSPSNPWEDATVCTMEYAPVCASVQVQCIKAPCHPIQQTFGNRCQMNANKLATFLYEGECKTK